VAKIVKTNLSITDKNLQQRELLPIYTAFPFNSILEKSSNLETIDRTKIFINLRTNDSKQKIITKKRVAIYTYDDSL